MRELRRRKTENGRMFRCKKSGSVGKVLRLPKSSVGKMLNLLESSVGKMYFCW